MKKAATMTDSQFNAFLKVIKSGNNPERNTTVLMLSHKLGLRAKELAALTIGDVIDDNGNVRDTVELVPSYTKGDKHRSVPLSNPKVITAVGDWIKYRQQFDGATFNHQSPLFRSQRGIAFNPNSMAHMIRNLYLNNGKKGHSSHSGRRSLITKLVNNGVSLNKVKAIAGHANIATTMEYVDTNPDDLAQIMKTMG